MLRNIYQKTVTHRNRTTKPKNEMVKDYTNQNQRSEATGLKKASPGCNPGALSHPFLQRKGCPRRAGCPNSKEKNSAYVFMNIQ
jgi:hypothetical protein